MNYVAILVAAVASMALGFLWYSPVLFGKQWMKASGISEEKMKKNQPKMAQTMGLSFLFTIVAAFVLAKFVMMGSVPDLMSGLTVGFWVWLGFVLTTMVTAVLFQEQRLDLFYITCGYQLVSFLLMGAILGAMA